VRGGRQYRVFNATRSTVLAERSNAATNMVSRGFGLMGKKSLPPGGGLIIVPCNSVISFFMRFLFDVVFVGGDGSVLHAVHSMRAWRTSRIVRGSKYVVELPAGTLNASQTVLGDRIELSEL
jgi:uncharacterized protein